MILYRGSNVEVKAPRLIRTDRRLDFGCAFYLTSDKDQAIRWAKLTAERKHEGQPIVTVFIVDDEGFQTLELKRFEAPNAKWLKYVAMNRKGSLKAETADVVIGPVANDQTSPVISLFLSGELSVAEAIRRLRPQQLKNQYAFRTEKALSFLQYKETILL